MTALGGFRDGPPRPRPVRAVRAPEPPPPPPEPADLDEITVEAPRQSWRPVDIEPVLAGQWEPPKPTIGRRTDGRGVFYPGKAHTVISETEGGKTWFALAVCLDEMKADQHVVYLDFEDDEGGVVGRLLTLGATRATIRDHFHYLRPESPITDRGNREDLAELLAAYRPTLAVLDGITEAMTVHSLDPNSNVDAALFGRQLTKPITDAGTATASLDHVVKATENRGRYALGAVHKINGLSGAQYVLENRSPFGVGMTGRSMIKIAKDRPGQLRTDTPRSDSGLHWFGNLVVKSHGQEFAEVTIEPPAERDEAFRYTQLMTAISDQLVKLGQPVSQRVLLAMVSGKSETKQAAFHQLIEGGYITASRPHTLIHPYVEVTEND